MDARSSRAACGPAADIGSLLRDMCLAILLIGETATADLAGQIGCVPANLDASPIGFRFLNVTWRQIYHNNLHC
jgi:hypothetical protein